MGEAEETVDLIELTKKLIREAREEEREQVLQAQKQLFDINKLKALKREMAYEEQVKGLNNRIDELETKSTTYVNVASRAADTVEELVTENEHLADDLEIVNKARVHLEDTLENTRTLLRNKISTLKAELKRCQAGGLTSIDWPSFMA
jgi:ABC-type transporter Mla subunit MlaD